MDQVTRVSHTSGRHSWLILKTLPQSHMGGLCNAVPLWEAGSPELRGWDFGHGRGVGRTALGVVRSVQLPRYLRLLSAERAGSWRNGGEETGCKETPWGLSENGDSLCFHRISRLIHVPATAGPASEARLALPCGFSQHLLRWPPSHCSEL